MNHKEQERQGGSLVEQVLGTEGQEGSGSPGRKERSVPRLGQEDGGSGRDELDRPARPGAEDAAEVGSSCSPTRTYSPPAAPRPPGSQRAEGRQSMGGWCTGCLTGTAGLAGPGILAKESAGDR